jgi:hypothetical protein
MGDYIQAWQCIGCGRIEAPQTCVGVCRDRKILRVGIRRTGPHPLASLSQQLGCGVKGNVARM